VLKNWLYWSSLLPAERFTDEAKGGCQRDGIGFGGGARGSALTVGQAQRKERKKSGKREENLLQGARCLGQTQEVRG